LCAVDEIVRDISMVPDDIVTTTNPTGGAGSWHVAKAPAGIRANALSCPSARLCVGAGVGPNVNGIAVVATNPTGGTSAWHVSEVGGTDLFVSATCPSASLCVLGDGSGEVAVSTMPAGGTWTAVSADPGAAAPIAALACPTTSTCVGGDGHGNMISSLAPTGAGTAWHVTPVDGQNRLSGVACPAPTVCVAFDDAGKVLTSTRPTGGASAWRVVPGLKIGPNLASFESTTRYDISCPSVSLCLAGDGGRIVTSTSPLGPASSWKTSADLGQTIVALSCPSVRLCVALDNEVPDHSAYVKVLASTDPTHGVWTTTVPMLPSAYTDYVNSVSCASAALCVAGGDRALLSSTNLVGGPSAWHVSASHGSQVNAVSCPSERLCVAVDDAGDVVTSTHPAHGPWRTTKLGHGVGVTYVSCPSRSLCVGTASPTSGLVVSTNPTGGRSAWRVTAIPSAGRRFLRAVSCASSSFCVAVGDGGIVVTGRR
jgi:hypothetical protein